MKRESAGSFVHGGNINPCNLDPSRRIFSSCFEICLAETGAFSRTSLLTAGTQFAVCLISSALESNWLHLPRNLARSTSVLASFVAFMYNSAAWIAFFKASSFVSDLSTLDSAAYDSWAQRLDRPQDVGGTWASASILRAIAIYWARHIERTLVAGVKRGRWNRPSDLTLKSRRGSVHGLRNLGGISISISSLETEVIRHSQPSKVPVFGCNMIVPYNFVPWSCTIPPATISSSCSSSESFCFSQSSLLLCSEFPFLPAVYLASAHFAIVHQPAKILDPAPNIFFTQSPKWLCNPKRHYCPHGDSQLRGPLELSLPMLWCTL